MRVLFLTTSFPRYSGDYAGIFVYDLARALTKIGVKIHVLAPHEDNSSSKEKLEGVDVTRFKYFIPSKYQRVAYGAGIPTNFRMSAASKIQLIPFLLSFLFKTSKFIPTCDIIHAHWIEPGLIGQLANTIYSRPFVISVHRSNPLGLGGRTIYNQVLGHADQIFYNSSYTKDRCQKLTRTRNGINLPPGVDTSRFFSKWSQQSTASISNGQENKIPIVLGVGSLVPVKGFIHFIEAMPAILECVDCLFVIGGIGPEHNTLYRRADQLGVSQNLVMLGQISTKDMPRVMREADVFILPSVPHASGDDEALGMVLIEALASGTPCIASRTGGTSDVIRDRIEGLLVAPGDSNEIAEAAIMLLQDSIMREQFGRAGRQQVENRYSVDRIASEVHSTYVELLSAY